MIGNPAITSIFSIILSFFTMISGIFGIVKNKPVPTYDVTGFEEKADDSIRVMSFNLRCTNVGKDSRTDRVDIVCAEILAGHPDSMGVQEATPGWMDDLKKNIGDEYDYVGVGRDNGKNLGEYSAVFYLKEKYNAVDSGTFWLSETPEKPSYGWDAACKRICTWVVLENKQTGEKYVHINSHFDHVSEQARQHSVQMVVAKASEFSSLPVVFTADMNVKQGSETYNSMVNSGVLFDTKFKAPDTMDYTTFHNTKPETHKDSVIDYIMINNNFNALVYRVVTDGVDGRFVSDHYPIYADLSIK